jgi:hypothetical protein
MTWWMMLFVIPWGLGMALPLLGVSVKLLKVAFNALAAKRPRPMLPWPPMVGPIERLQ